MKHKYLRILAFACVVSVLVIAAVTVSMQQTAVRVRYESPALGTVWAQDELSHHVMLVNQTSEPLEISHFYTSCGCTSVKPDKLTIAPKSSATIDVLINTLDGKLITNIGIPTPRSFAIRPQLEDGSFLHKLELAANIRSPIAVDPTKLRFVEPLIPQHRSAPLTVGLTVCPEICALEPINDDPRIDVTCDPIEKGACRLNVAFNGNSTVGPLKAVVGLRPKLRDESYLPRLSLHVFGNITPDLVLDPAVIYVPENRRSVPLSSGKEFKSIKFVVASRSGAALNGLRIATNREPQYLGEPLVRGIGTSNATVEVDLRAPDERATTVVVSVEAQVEGQNVNPSLELPVILTQSGTNRML